MKTPQDFRRENVKELFDKILKDNKTKLHYSMPIDMLYKWYPKEMKKDEEFNDDIPF